MLSQEKLNQYRRQGFIKGSKILSEDEIDVLQKEVLRVIEQREDKTIPQPVMVHDMGQNGKAIWQIVNIYQASGPFRALVSNPTIAEEVAQLSDARELRLWHDQIQFKPAGTGGVNMWHQDSPYWRTLQPKDSQVTAWIALDDVDQENGCMSMVPGSQRFGDTIEYLHTLKDFASMPREFKGQPIDVVLCPVKRGEVHYHHSLTWHGSNANTSGRPRRAIALHFMNEKTTFNASGNHVMKEFIRVANGQKIQGEAFLQVWPTK